MRVQFNLSDIMVEELDCLSELIGISRSDLIVVFIRLGIIEFVKYFPFPENE